MKIIRSYQVALCVFYGKDFRFVISYAYDTFNVAMLVLRELERQWWRVGVEIERTRGMGVERGCRDRTNTRDGGGERVSR